MNSFICFINLFFIPFISLFIYSKIKNMAFPFNMQTLIQYAIYVVTNLIITHCFVVLIRKTVKMIITYDALTYSLIAAIVAVIIPIMASFFAKFIEVKCTIEKVEKDEK